MLDVDDLNDPLYNVTGNRDSIAISDDGCVLAVGDDDDDNSRGKVQLFDVTSDTATQIGGDIVGPDEGDNCGLSVDLSKDGKRVVIGCLDKALIATLNKSDHDNPRWDIEQEFDLEGFSQVDVAISSDAQTVVFGGPNVVQVYKRTKPGLGLPTHIIKVSTKDYFTQGHDMHKLWGDAGPIFLHGIDYKPGSKLVWTNDPICEVTAHDGHDITPNDLKECINGENIIGSASGVCTTVSVYDYKKGTQFDCLYKEVLYFNKAPDDDCDEEGDRDFSDEGNFLEHTGMKSTYYQAVTGGTGALKGAFGSIYKKPIYGAYDVLAGWHYDLSHVKLGGKKGRTTDK